MSLWEGYIISNTDYVDVRVNTGRHKVLWGKSFEEPFELVAPVFEDLFVEYAKMMKDWDEAGVWRKDVLNFEGDTRANLRAGQSASDQHHSNTYRYLRVEMDELIPGSDLPDVCMVRYKRKSCCRAHYPWCYRYWPYL